MVDTSSNKPLVNLPNPIQSVTTSEKLASIADVSEKTYRMKKGKSTHW